MGDVRLNTTNFKSIPHAREELGKEREMVQKKHEGGRGLEEPRNKLIRRETVSKASSVAYWVMVVAVHRYCPACSTSTPSSTK